MRIPGFGGPLKSLLHDKELDVIEAAVELTEVWDIHGHVAVRELRPKVVAAREALVEAVNELHNERDGKWERPE